MHTWLLVVVFATGQHGFYTGEVGKKAPFHFKSLEACEQVLDSEKTRLSKEVPVEFELDCIEVEAKQNGTST